MKFLKGKLTYILAVLSIAYGIFGFLMGYMDGEQAMMVIWTGLAAFGIRRALP